MKSKGNLTQRLCCLKMFIAALMGFNTIALAKDITVTQLNSGACWYSYNQSNLKITSFNDKTSFSSTMPMLESINEELIFQKLNNKSLVRENYKTLSVGVHCSSVGASIVMRSRVNQEQFCSWLYVKEGKLDVRGLGYIQDEKDDRVVCDGVVPLELIVGVKDAKSYLDSHGLNNYFDDVSSLSKNLIKVNLKKEYFGKEQEIIDEMRKSDNVRFIEFNSYQYPIGEFVEIK